MGEGTHRAGALGIVVVPVDGEHGDRDVEVWVFVVNRGEPITNFRALIRAPIAIATMNEMDGIGERGERETHEYPSALPSSGSLRSSISTGLSPSVYSRRSAITWYKHPREGLFSWKRSPASRMKSTWERYNEVSVRMYRVNAKP